MTRTHALVFGAALTLAACSPSPGPESPASQEPEATSAAAVTRAADVSQDDECVEMMSPSKAAFRAETKAACNASTTLAEVAQNPACMTQERIERCETKQWGARTGGLILAPKQ